MNSNGDFTNTCIFILAQSLVDMLRMGEHCSEVSCDCQKPTLDNANDINSNAGNQSTAGGGSSASSEQKRKIVVILKKVLLPSTANSD